MVKTAIAQPHGLVSVRRSLALGDAVCATVVADRLLESGLQVDFQTNPAFHDLLSWHGGLRLKKPEGNTDIDLDQTYEKDPLRRHKHFHQMFFEAASAYDAHLFKETANCRPHLSVPKACRDVVCERLAKHPRPWIYICPRSNSYRVRQVNDGIWEQVAKRLPGTCFWMGTYPAPPGIVPLDIRYVRDIATTLSAADLLLTVDTGPMHVAAAIGIPMVVVGQSSDPELHLNDQNDFIVTEPDLDCLNCQKNVCPISGFMPPCQNIEPERITEAAKARISTGVSCVIPILRPTQARLQRCLDSVADQVDEIVITGESSAVLPPVKLPENAKFVQKQAGRIGFGRNVNFGLRHTSGKRVLILNDDVVLMENAVALLEQAMRKDVGLVGHLLWYPNGRIYHGGVIRGKGTLDWGHLDHNAYTPSINQVCEMEQVTGASILVDRKAFYEAGGFDERFFLYCEDNDLCMKIRQKGWKIAYTPLAQGTHESMQSSRTIPNYLDLMRQSQMLFHQKWDWYLKKNINVSLGTF